DQPDKVAEDDAVLMAQPGAGQYDGRQTRIRDMDRNARRDKYRIAWRNGQWFADARSQIHAGRAGGGIRRQMLTYTVIENLELNGRFLHAYYLLRRKRQRAALFRTVLLSSEHCDKNNPSLRRRRLHWRPHVRAALGSRISSHRLRRFVRRTSRI